MKAFKVLQRHTDHSETHRYLNELDKIKVLSHQEELDLLDKWHSDREYVIDQLIKHNLRFVVSVAKQYHKKGGSLADLINEGNLGLIKAARRFDPAKENRFISFAVWWIRQGVMSYVSQQANMIRLPENVHQKAARISKQPTDLTDEEMATAARVTVDDVFYIRSVTRNVFSIDEPINEDGGGYELRGSLDIDQDRERDATKLIVSQALDVLTDKERKIMSMYYGIGQSALYLTSISEEVGVTRARVQQIIKKSLEKMRAAIQRNAART